MVFFFSFWMTLSEYQDTTPKFMLSLKPFEKYGNYFKPVKIILAAIFKWKIINIFHWLSTKNDRIIGCVYNLIIKSSSREYVDQCSHFISGNMNQKIKNNYTLRHIVLQYFYLYVEENSLCEKQLLWVYFTIMTWK